MVEGKLRTDAKPPPPPPPKASTAGTADMAELLKASTAGTAGTAELSKASTAGMAELVHEALSASRMLRAHERWQKLGTTLFCISQLADVDAAQRVRATRRLVLAKYQLVERFRARLWQLFERGLIQPSSFSSLSRLCDDDCDHLDLGHHAYRVLKFEDLHATTVDYRRSARPLADTARAPPQVERLK